MTSNETAAAVRALLESYRDAFERLDAAAIADHFARGVNPASELQKLRSVAAEPTSSATPVFAQSQACRYCQPGDGVSGLYLVSLWESRDCEH